jgi:hypothetical protein
MCTCPAAAKWQVIPKHEPRLEHIVDEPPTAPVGEPAMIEWEKSISKKYKEEKVVVQTIMTRWIALLFKSKPVPLPKTKWEKIVAPGFKIYLDGLREAGLTF